MKGKGEGAGAEDKLAHAYLQKPIIDRLTKIVLLSEILLNM